MTDLQRTNPRQTLMEKGGIVLDSVGPQPLELWRGMVVLDGAGDVAGHLAAIVLGDECHQVTHILLVNKTPQLHYRLVPAELITSVTDNAAQLKICQQVIEALPIWRGS